MKGNMMDALDFEVEMKNPAWNVFAGIRETLIKMAYENSLYEAWLESQAEFYRDQEQ